VAARTTAVADTPPTADTLEARGHQLMVNGAYSEAIPLLRQAIDAAPPGELTYAYALYDLGRALRLAGDPQAAIPVLEHRLQIPNQLGVVLSELQLARRAAGMAAPGIGGGGPPAQGSPPDGGAGLAPAGPPGHDHRHHGNQQSGNSGGQNQGD
jgi:serine/threonine-protein kinase